MAVTDTWVSPAAGGVLDLATGGTVTEAVWDAVISDLLVLGGTAKTWTDFTPTVIQGASITVSIANARYKILGKTAFVLADILLQSAGTAANAIQIQGIPAVIAPKHLSEDSAVIGSFKYFDTGTTHRIGVVTAYQADKFVLNVDVSNVLLGVAGPTVASGDGISLQLCYEIA